MNWYLKAITEELPRITAALEGIERQLHAIDFSLGILALSLWGVCILYFILHK